MPVRHSGEKRSNETSANVDGGLSRTNMTFEGSAAARASASSRDFASDTDSGGAISVNVAPLRIFSVHVE